ncbi:hypothetical protein B0A52_08681 [Exophiala mesophila]|uniref:Heterokaryon incompatibility domain-containing protein n=1 Tax=Exophiala mesophila TaxID=212818 RepID=A0A438MYH6_EXOME|nr:hypothetical protein B0A52_08681 [Exophiala mesophila]
MDHITKPFDPVSSDIPVPRLSNNKYDGLDFATYPDRRGWDLSRLLAGDFSQHDREATSGFLQDWLFFGTLATVIAETAKDEVASYVQAGGDSKYGYVNTSLLPKHLHDRLNYLKVMAFDQPELAKTLVRSAEKCLQILSYMCCMASCSVNGLEPTEDKKVIWPLPPEVDLSLRVLGQLFASAFYGGLMTDFLTSRLPPTSLPQLQFPPGNLLVSRMRQSGWCPSDVSMVSQDFSPSTMVYLSRMKREATSRDHSACTRQKCFAFQIDDSTYTSKHCQENCTCEYVGPQIDQVVKIIAGGGVPLMSIVVDQVSDDIEIKVEEYKPGQEYVCFSHVWSDGLGNANDNTLPRCQILRLRGLLDDLAGMKSRRELLNTARFSAFMRKQRKLSMRFWIDTLCVPVQKEHVDIRKLAIRHMNNVYAKTYHLLVLDAELQKIAVPDLRETLLRVSICGWMRRLWTLLEGVVGARAHVKFKDRIIDLETVYEQFSEDDQQLDMYRLMRQSAGSLESDAVKFYWKMALFRKTIRSSDSLQRKMFGYTVTYETKFFQGKAETMKYDANLERQSQCLAVMEAFVASRWRTTSRREDVYLCLANLLGWNTEGLSKVPVEQRMRNLLEQQQHLPQGLIFVSGSRMTEPGWRWAVTDFDSPGTSPFGARIPINDSTAAHRDGNGLTFKYPGLLLPSTLTNITDEQILVPTADDGGSDQLKWWRIRLDNQQVSHVEANHVGPYYGFALIFYDGRGNVETPIPGNVAMAAILVSLDAEPVSSTDPVTTAAITACSFISLAIIEVIGSAQEFMALGRRKDLNIRFVEDEAQLVRQRWTIG